MEPNSGWRLLGYDSLGVFGRFSTPEIGLAAQIRAWSHGLLNSSCQRRDFAVNRVF